MRSRRFRARQMQQLGFDAVDGGFDAFGGDRPLAQRERQAAEELVATVFGAAAVLLTTCGILRSMRS